MEHRYGNTSRFPGANEPAEKICDLLLESLEGSAGSIDNVVYIYISLDMYIEYTYIYICMIMCQNAVRPFTAEI